MEGTPRNLLRASFSSTLSSFLANSRCPERRGYPTQIVFLMVNAEVVVNYTRNCLVFLKRISNSVHFYREYLWAAGLNFRSWIRAGSSTSTLSLHCSALNRLSHAELSFPLARIFYLYCMCTKIWVASIQTRTDGRQCCCYVRSCSELGESNRFTACRRSSWKRTFQNRW